MDGQYARSVEVGDRVMVMSGRHPWGMLNIAVACAAAGDMVGARAIHDEFCARAVRAYVSPFHRGIVAALVGEKDLATALLREAIARRDPALPLFLRWASGQPAIRGLEVAGELLQAARLPGIAAGRPS